MILENIAADTIMTVKEKNDFKAILQTLVYGSFGDIPSDVVDPIIENPPEEE
jgi:hypothetical protein